MLLISNFREMDFKGRYHTTISDDFEDQSYFRDVSNVLQNR